MQSFTQPPHSTTTLALLRRYTPVYIAYLPASLPRPASLFSFPPTGSVLHPCRWGRMSELTCLGCGKGVNEDKQGSHGDLWNAAFGLRNTSAQAQRYRMLLPAAATNWWLELGTFIVILLSVMLSSLLGATSSPPSFLLTDFSSHNFTMMGKKFH